MPADPDTATGEGAFGSRPRTAERQRRRDAAVAGHRGDARAARGALHDASGAVRAVALGAVGRTGTAGSGDVVNALADPDARVRRRATAVAVAVTGRGSRSVLPAALRAALGDPDALVVEGACWALGERRERAAVTDLAAVAAGHHDTRCREAAVAALGAIGDPGGLSAVLARLSDRPTVRRRAVVALAAFGGPEVEAALRRCREDRDWQVRQAADALLAP